MNPICRTVDSETSEARIACFTVKSYESVWSHHGRWHNVYAWIVVVLNRNADVATVWITDPKILEPK
jgi:hypothetical protein